MTVDFPRPSYLSSGLARVSAHAVTTRDPSPSARRRPPSEVIMRLNRRAFPRSPSVRRTPSRSGTVVAAIPPTSVTARLSLDMGTFLSPRERRVMPWSRAFHRIAPFEVCTPFNRSVQSENHDHAPPAGLVGTSFGRRLHCRRHVAVVLQSSSQSPDVLAPTLAAVCSRSRCSALPPGRGSRRQPPGHRHSISSGSRTPSVGADRRVPRCAACSTSGAPRRQRGPRTLRAAWCWPARRRRQVSWTYCALGTGLAETRNAADCCFSPIRMPSLRWGLPSTYSRPPSRSAMGRRWDRSGPAAAAAPCKALANRERPCAGVAVAIARSKYFRNGWSRSRSCPVPIASARVRLTVDRAAHVRARLGSWQCENVSGPRSQAAGLGAREIRASATTPALLDQRLLHSSPLVLVAALAGPRRPHH